MIYWVGVSALFVLDLLSLHAAEFCTSRWSPPLIFLLSFAAPPTFTETPPQYIEAKEGGSITMTCTAFGNPKPIVTWLKEGTLLGASAKYQVSQLSPECHSHAS